MKTFLKQINKTTICFFVCIFFILLFLYHNNLNAFFVSDDFDWITVSKDRDPATFFTTNYIGEIGGGSYGPMVNLVFYLTYKIGNLNPLPYHMVSILFHFGNIILIFLLSKHFFGKKTAYLASFLFAIYFNNSEAVSWIAVIPHLGATFFFLLSIYLWLNFFKQNKRSLLLFSLVSFLISLMFKEIALSLPFVLIVLYFVKSTKSNTKIIFKKYFLNISIYFLILATYLALRFYTTNISTGYYGNEGLDFNFTYYLKNFISYLVTFFFSGEYRSSIRGFSENNIWLSTSLIISILWLIGFYTKNIKQYLSAIFIIIFTSGVYLPLLMNPLSNEGERYLYLPSTIIFIIISHVAVKSYNKQKITTLTVLTIFIIFSVHLLYQKNQIWHLGSTISKQIIDDISKYTSKESKVKKIIFLYLPDNILGTQIFRNAIREATNLFYPKNNLEINVEQTYIILNQDSWDNNLITWKKLENGFLGETINNEPIITGLARQENDDIIYELWGYDYNNFTTDKIYFNPKGNFIKKPNTLFLYFDEGFLKELDIQ